MIEEVDRLLAEQSVLVVIGRGGVGKTTVTAALGARAARNHGRRVLVVTVDPARRLADALGVHGLEGEAVLVSVGDVDGRLWVLMVEMSRAWDQLVRHSAPDQATAEALLANPLYRSLTTRFVASHDYVALDQLSLLNEGRYDLIIVDTPPGEHAADIFAAPGRLRQFFDSRLLRWLTVGVGGGFRSLAARPFLLVAERLLGGDFLTRIGEFFTLFSLLRDGLVDRIDKTEAVLGSPRTAMIEVRAADSIRVDRPVSGGIDLVLVNRLLPTASVEVEREEGDRRSPGSTLVRIAQAGGADRPAAEQSRDLFENESLSQAVESLLAGSPDIDLALPHGTGLALLPRCAGGLSELDDLVMLTDQAASRTWAEVAPDR